MAILPLVYAPHPIFKEKAQRIDIITNEIIALGNDMLETMYYYKVLGIGANMVNVKQQIIVLDVNPPYQPYIMFNPEIIEKSNETDFDQEGSLSYPGIYAQIPRAKEIKVKYLDINGQQQIIKAKGLMARVIMHETDYLNGIVFLDYLSKLKRDLLLKKLKKNN